MSGKDYPRFTLRVELTSETLLGPGKAALLESIGQTGSISAAGRELGMSYKRAWYLIETLNTSFADPLVISMKGGKTGGGASLTATGKKVLALYRRLERKTRSATTADMKTLAAMAKK